MAKALIETEKIAWNTRNLSMSKFESGIEKSLTNLFLFQYSYVHNVSESAKVLIGDTSALERVREREKFVQTEKLELL